MWYLAILDNKMSWFTRLKALLRSKNTNPTSLLLSIAFSQLSVRLNKAVSEVAALCVIFQRRAEGFVMDICPAKKRIALEQKSVERTTLPSTNQIKLRVQIKEMKLR